MFFNTRHPDLLYCFQTLFPFLTILLLVVYGCGFYYSTKRYIQKHVDCSSSWATVTAHAVISFAFTVFVIILDVVALVFWNTAPDYYTASFNTLLFNYPGVTLFWDGIALTTLAIVMIMVMIVVCCVQKQGLNTQREQMEFVFQLLTLAAWGSSPNFHCFTCPLLTCCCNNRCFLCHWHWNLLWNILLCASVTAKENVWRSWPAYSSSPR